MVAVISKALLLLDVDHSEERSYPAFPVSGEDGEKISAAWCWLIIG
jgi:hypothetical protein